MSCEETRARIEERQDGLLTATEAADVDAHVQTCPTCMQETLEARTFETLLRDAGGPDLERNAVRSLSQALSTSRAARRRRWFVATVSAALLAVGLLILRPWEAATRTLPSGLQAHLVAGSEARVGRAHLLATSSAQLRASSDGRTVRLDAGAVRFRVDPDTTPFSVETPAGFVRVLGTEFEVRVMQKKHWIGAGVLTTVLVTSGLVLLENNQGDVRAPAGTVAVMREGQAPTLLDSAAVTSIVLENDALRAEVESLRKAAGLDGPTLLAGDGARDSESVPESTAPKTADAKSTPSETDGVEVSMAIAETDWSRLGEAVLVMLNDDEEGEQAPTPETAIERAYVMSRLAQLGAEFKVRMGPNVLLHPRIRERFLGGLLRAALPDMGDEGRERVIDSVGDALATHDLGESANLLPMELTAAKLKAGLEAAETIRTELTSSQNVVILKLLTLLQEGFSSSINISTSNTAESLASTVATSMVERIKIKESDRSALTSATRRFVEAHLLARTALQDKYGVDAHDLVQDPEKVRTVLGEETFRHARLIAWERFARIQAAMDRAIYDDMPADVRERMRVPQTYWYLVRLSAD